MKGRPIDCSKPKNRKCEYCDEWMGVTDLGATGTCLNPGSKNFTLSKKYWHTCKSFHWREDKEYINKS